MMGGTGRSLKDEMTMVFVGVGAFCAVVALLVGIIAYCTYQNHKLRKSLTAGKTELNWLANPLVNQSAFKPNVSMIE